MKEAVLCLRAASFIVAKSVYYLSQRKKRSNPINKQTYLFYSQPKLGRLFFFDKRCVVELDVAINATMGRLQRGNPLMTYSQHFNKC